MEPDSRDLFGPEVKVSPVWPTRAWSASTTIRATAEAVFGVLADPSTHASIDGTGWVQRAEDRDPITAAGQVFRMRMYHEGHPDRFYETANLVEVFDEPHAIAWKTGTEDTETGQLSFGGWTWRYDLEPTGPSQTTVMLTYDWSDVGPKVQRVHGLPRLRARPPRQLPGAPRRPRHEGMNHREQRWE